MTAKETSKEFTFEILEYLSRVVTIKAETEEEAEYKLREQYRNCEIVLDAEDYVQTDFLIHIDDEWYKL